MQRTPAGPYNTRSLSRLAQNDPDQENEDSSDSDNNDYTYRPSPQPPNAREPGAVHAAGGTTVTTSTTSTSGETVSCFRPYSIVPGLRQISPSGILCQSRPRRPRFPTWQPHPRHRIRTLRQPQSRLLLISHLLSTACIRPLFPREQRPCQRHPFRQGRRQPFLQGNMLHIQWRLRNQQQTPSLWAQASVRPEPLRQSPTQPAPMEEDSPGPSQASSMATITLTPCQGRPHFFTIRIVHDLAFQPKISTFLRAQDSIILVVRCTKTPASQASPPGSQGTLTRVMRLLDLTPGVIHGHQQTPTPDNSTPQRSRRQQQPRPRLPPPPFQWPPAFRQEMPRLHRRFYPPRDLWWPTM